MADRLLKVDCVARQPHHERAMQKLAAGLRRHGIAVNITPSIEGEGDFAACWGWKVGRRIKAAGRRVLVMELGYVGDRTKWTSIAWDGLNGRGRGPEVEDGGERWRRLFGAYLKPWRLWKRDQDIVIMGQVDGDASVDGVNLEAWYAQAAEAALRFNHRVVFRRHPLSDYEPPWVISIRGSLHSALERACCVIAYNSNAGVDAVLAGVPTLACDEGCMAWPVAGHGLMADPPVPDRWQWCARLAWRQWSDEEIERGEAWEYLKSSI